MKSRILDDSEINKFVEKTEIKATRVIIYQNYQFFYAMIVDDFLMIKIRQELAKQFI